MKDDILKTNNSNVEEIVNPHHLVYIENELNKFIYGKLNYFFIKFKTYETYGESNHNLCHFRNVNYNGDCLPNYEDESVQLIYLLRYFAAYVCEYYYAYQQIAPNLDEINVLSLGCGAFLDYYGLYYAKRKSTGINYFGVDKINWKYKYNLNKNNSSTDTCHFIHKDIKGINNETLSINKEINTIIFPKSIGEINCESIPNILNALKNIKTNSTLYVMNFECMYGDEFIFDELLSQTCNSLNYKIISKTKYEFNCEQKRSGLQKISANFIFPNEVNDYFYQLRKKCNKKTHLMACCGDCLGILLPITTVQYIKFQIAELKR